MKKFISYTRVSTQQQGLGLEAQTAIIGAYVQQHGGTIIAAYSEKSSGKDTINRPELQAAIAQAKQENAVLIVAKLDRLSRDISDIFALKKDKNLSFEVCDMDASDTLMLGIFATLAQKERELISRRTRESLAARKKQKLAMIERAKEAEKKGDKQKAQMLYADANAMRDSGNPNATEQIREVQRMGWAARKQKAQANESNRHAYDAIRLMPGTLQSKCDYLNSNGYRTRNGKQFSPMQVKRLLAMYNPA